MFARLFSLQGKIVNGLTPFQSAFLLVVRLYWGWTLIVAGWNKFANFGGTVSYFEGLGLPAAGFNAFLSGAGELGGGLFLLLGLLSRPAAVVLTFNFIIAYIFGHSEAAAALFTQPAEFIDAPAFSYLFVSLLVLLFGPGRLSLDALLAAKFKGKGEGESGAPASDQGMSRRDAGVLAGAALGGVVAGMALPRLFSGGDGAESQTASSGSAQPSDGASGGGSAGGGEGQVDVANYPALQEVDAEAPEGVVPTQLLKEPHTCCGLNTCQGLGKSGENACAGQGTCATAETHVCQGLNSCKGQGGCGEYPGQNSCDGKGSCAVPLDKKQWKIARERFEELMSKAGRSVGKPPESCKQAAG